MGRDPFVARSPGGLARVPLLPAEAAHDHSLPAADPLLVEGVLLASRQVGAAALSPASPLDDRLVVTLRGYEIRARWRPTPHGAFAGVALARFSSGASDLRLGGSHRARSNPSALWLAAVATQLLDDPDVLSQVTLTTSNLVIRRGRRFEHEQQAPVGGTGPQRVTIRATEATVLILTTCQAGATLDQVIMEVRHRWPSVPDSVVTATVLSLIRSGFLLTDLLPDDVTADPLRHLLGKLPAASAMRQKVSRLRELLADADRYPPGDPVRLKALSAARDLADGIFFTERPLTVDVVADARIILPTALADEAARSAGVLWRIGSGRDPLTGYHGRFLERYGPHRLVPLLEATDPAIGVGLDSDVSDSDAEAQPPARTAALADLLARGTAHGGIEVVLDEQTITALAHNDLTEPPPRTAEIYVRVLAATQRDLAVGRLHLAVCPGDS